MRLGLLEREPSLGRVRLVYENDRDTLRHLVRVRGKVRDRVGGRVRVRVRLRVRVRVTATVRVRVRVRSSAWPPSASPPGCSCG